jgi:hypothetical protein
MTRACWIVGVLALAGSALVAADKKDPSGAKQQPVVVDPLDLRMPIPEPGAGLTEKYDGKLVRFAGRVKTSGQDAKTKTYWYDLQVEIVHPPNPVSPKKQAPASGSGKKNQGTQKEIVVVRAYFDTAQPGLQKAGNEATVQGRGEISLVDGSLSIRQATVLDPNFLRRAAASER